MPFSLFRMFGKVEKKTEPAAAMPTVNVIGIGNGRFLLGACVVSAALLPGPLLAAGIMHHGLTRLA